mmetsp:Transcript_8682/g.32477  ORF Transcript_8682/g.32477 Transcript_8682/m.32477 type:complete len:208 (-) Transcript_8682:1291-1914(-)
MGSVSIIECSSWKCPRSTILSASSSTRKFNRPKSRKCSWPCAFMSSHKRPGVATTISGRFDSNRSCFCKLIPPTTGTIPISGACFPIARSMSHTCMASSRVGATISARRALRRFGSLNPAVAPVRPDSSRTFANGSSGSCSSSAFFASSTGGFSSSLSLSLSSRSWSICVSSRCRMGIPKARVFPLPVSAAPITSHRPLIAGFKHSL